MRGAGLPIEVLIEYVSLFQQGEETRDARKEILIEQRKLLQGRMEDMQKTLDRLNHKIEFYENIIMPKEKALSKADEL